MIFAVYSILVIALSLDALQTEFMLIIHNCRLAVNRVYWKHNQLVITERTFFNWDKSLDYDKRHFPETESFVLFRHIFTIIIYLFYKISLLFINTTLKSGVKWPFFFIDKLFDWKYLLSYNVVKSKEVITITKQQKLCYTTVDIGRKEHFLRVRTSNTLMDVTFGRMTSILRSDP